MQENSKIKALLHGLFDTDVFTEDVVSQAVTYYMDVFGNVLSRDVGYRMNSNIMKGATVGLRQRLSAGGRVTLGTGKMILQPDGSSVEMSKRHSCVRITFDGMDKKFGGQRRSSAQFCRCGLKNSTGWESFWR